MKIFAFIILLISEATKKENASPLQLLNTVMMLNYLKMNKNENDFYKKSYLSHMSDRFANMNEWQAHSDLLIGIQLIWLKFVNNH